MKKTHESLVGSGSLLAKYQNVMIGSKALSDLLYYEWCMLLAPVPGAFGMLLRKLFWPRMFASCGKGCLFGVGMTVRHPRRIRLGNSVVISEGCILDGRHDRESVSMIIGNDVILSNCVMLSCKNGTISIGDRCGLNAHAIVQSTSGCPVTMGPDCLVGQRCLIIGGGNYRFDRLDIPIREQGIRADGGVRLESDVWLGGNVTVLGGVVMGRGSIAGAGTVLTRSVGECTVSLGIPAKVVKMRNQGPEQP